MSVETKENKSVRRILDDIILYISWAHISKNYFGKSRSWLSQKMIGRNGNGAKTDFNEQERSILKGALYDLSERIRKVADGL